MNLKKIIWLAALLGLLGPLALGAAEGPVSAMFFNETPVQLLRLYERWVGKPVAVGPGIKAMKKSVTLKFKNVDQEIALKLTREALLNQAGIAIERDADGHLRATVTGQSSVNPTKP